jgi:hypothetical protein
MYNFINARELVLVILFIDLDVRRRICQHLHFLTIKLNFVIKRMINPTIPIEETPINLITKNIINLLKNIKMLNLFND